MNRYSTGARAMLAGVLTSLLAACSSGGSIDIGGGQAADPGTVDFPIAYVKRYGIPQGNGDLRQQRDTQPDADLYFRDRASPASAERNITARLRENGNELFDIRDVDVSPDGTKLVFALRGPLRQNQNEIDPPFWRIWEYALPPGDTLRQVSPSGSGNDIAPQYLPDGRIVFSSTRQVGSKAILLDEGKSGYEAQVEVGRNESAFLLHVMNADGTDLRQITYNQSHDLWPSLLADGRIVFTRWDGATGRGMHLYTVNPDGTDLQLLYGARSHNTGTPGPSGDPTAIQFTRPREMQDGRILAFVRPYTGADFGGDLVLVDTNTYVENTQPLAASAGMQGPAQSRATPNQVSTLEGPSPGGRFRSAWPLWDGSNRLLVSWSLCRLLDTTVTPAVIVPCTPQRLADADAQAAPPLYSGFVFDPARNTFRPLFEPAEGVMVTDLVAAQPRRPPDLRLDQSMAGPGFDPSLVPEGVGLLEIRSVYDFDGTARATPTGAPIDIATFANPAATTAGARPARFLRIEKAVSIGDDDLDPGFPNLQGAAFGASNFMREILGYVPIEPDGSVSVRVPANTAFVISVLDANGRRLFPQHRNWLQLRPGEVRRCNGCHRPATGTAQDLSHGRGRGVAPGIADDPYATSLPAPWIGAVTTGTAPFPNTLPLTAANAQAGDTMAQARARTSCVPGNLCSQVPSVNVVYDDVWTDPAAAGRDPDRSDAWTYGSAAGFSTPPPVRAGCMSAWSSTCRIVVNYVQHIHPLWYVPRITLDVDGVTVLADRTCTSCHAPTDDAGVFRDPDDYGQLDLSDGDSNQVAQHKNAYRQLLFARVEQELVGGVLQPRTREVVTVDPDTGETIVEPVPITTGAPLQAQNARGSVRFFCNNGNGNPCVERFGPNGSHANGLNPAELRLISEWVDIGAQYFNDPFADGVPVN